MSLDYDLRKLDDRERSDTTTTAMIFLTMTVGISEITEKNAEEFYARTYAWETAVGTMRRGPDGGSLRITPADVRDYIGLRTNASPLTKTQFAAKVMRGLRENADREWDKS